ncbi:MAG: hypothetical protein AB7F79_13395 [Steroidobacteraceae bacterium]
MNASRKVTSLYAPQSRAIGSHILLEELGAEYDLAVLNLKAGDNLKPEYLAINPFARCLPFNTMVRWLPNKRRQIHCCRCALGHDVQAVGLRFNARPAVAKARAAEVEWVAKFTS